MLALIGHSASALENHVRNHLADSLTKVTDFLAQEGASFDSSRASISILNIRKKKASPHIYSRYFDIVLNLNKNNYSKATQMISEICSLSQIYELDILPYSEPSLGDDYHRYPMLVFKGFSKSTPIDTPEPHLFESHKTKITHALKIIRNVDQASYDAFTCLINEIIVGISKDKQNSFGGASSLMTWGAIFINAQHYASLPKVVEFIIHELTHCVLFGINAKKTLVLNSTNELFPSALRRSLRPMDGIYHATLVCAHVAMFMQKWMLSENIDQKETDQVSDILARNKKNFKLMLPVVKKHGKLSTEAADILARTENKILDVGD